MTQEALDSPGCTRAVITTARRALRAAGSLQKEVMVIRSQAFPARVSQSLRRRRRRTMLGSSRKTERIGQFLRKLSKIGVVQWWEINGDFTAKHASGVEKAASKIVIEPPNVEDFRWSPTILRIWNQFITWKPFWPWWLPTCVGDRPNHGVHNISVWKVHQLLMDPHWRSNLLQAEDIDHGPFRAPANPFANQNRCRDSNVKNRPHHNHDQKWLWRSRCSSWLPFAVANHFGSTRYGHRSGPSRCLWMLGCRNTGGVACPHCTPRWVSPCWWCWNDIAGRDACCPLGRSTTECVTWCCSLGSRSSHTSEVRDAAMITENQTP